MSKKIDLTGKQFGEWTVISFDKSVTKEHGSVLFWNCRCNCGTERSVSGNNLRSGGSTNCGCVRGRKRAELNSLTLSKENVYYFVGEVGHGKFFNSNNEFLFDKEDYEKIKGICWWESNGGYVQGKIKNNGKIISLHHLVFEYNGIIDHRNRNRLDCRKENLVPSTDMDNRQNSTLQKSNKTGCAGVKWHSLSNKWSADITYHRKRIHLGTFNNIEDAILARLTKEVEICDDLFHRTNTPLLKKYGFI